MIEVRANSYRTRYQWVGPGLARMERLHRWRKEPEVMIEVLGRFWMFGFTDFPEGLLSFGRHGELIPVSGKKCIFLPPFSVFESHIAGGNREMCWEAIVALGDLPPGLPQSPIVFDAPSESYPKSMMEVSSILRAARNVVAIGKEERASAVAYKAKSFLDQHLTEEHTIHEMARELRFSHAVMDRAFKSCFGLSPVSYRARARVLSAAFLMTLSRKRVSEAAMLMGFSSLDHFTRQFRRYMNARPLEYLASLG